MIEEGRKHRSQRAGVKPMRTPAHSPQPQKYQELDLHMARQSRSNQREFPGTLCTQRSKMLELHGFLHSTPKKAGTTKGLFAPKSAGICTYDATRVLLIS